MIPTYITPDSEMVDKYSFVGSSVTLTCYTYSSETPNVVNFLTSSQVFFCFFLVNWSFFYKFLIIILFINYYKFIIIFIP